MLFVPFFCISTLQSMQFIRLLYSGKNIVVNKKMGLSLFICELQQLPFKISFRNLPEGLMLNIQIAQIRGIIIFCTTTTPSMGRGKKHWSKMVAAFSFQSRPTKEPINNISYSNIFDILHSELWC